MIQALHRLLRSDCVYSLEKHCYIFTGKGCGAFRQSTMASSEPKPSAEDCKQPESPGQESSGVVKYTDGPRDSRSAPGMDGDAACQVMGKDETSGGKTLSKRAARKMLRKQQENRKRKRDEAKLVKQKSVEEETKDVNFTDAQLQETAYYFQNGLRKVYPYPFTFTSYAKGRWLGRSILDVFTEEFRADSPEIYKKAIETGRMTVNDQTVTPDYKLKSNDFIQHKVHRHESPVTASPIKILEEDEDVVIVDKPSSIPIHPCGKYRHNSLTYILAKEFGLGNLRTINRIDRLTSGLYILCKTEKKTKHLMEHIKTRQVQKEYLCRVIGEFPSEQVECCQPLQSLSQKLGMFRVGPNGKEAKTTFQRISYNGRTSVVKCLPFTGRTHQIRVHLQYLGYPIVNDPLYNSEVWGPDRGKGGHFGKSDNQLINELVELHKREQHVVTKDVESTAAPDSDNTEDHQVVENSSKPANDTSKNGQFATDTSMVKTCQTTETPHKDTETDKESAPTDCAQSSSSSSAGAGGNGAQTTGAPTGAPSSPETAAAPEKHSPEGDTSEKSSSESGTSGAGPPAPPSVEAQGMGALAALGAGAGMGMPGASDMPPGGMPPGMSPGFGMAMIKMHMDMLISAAFPSDGDPSAGPQAKKAKLDPASAGSANDNHNFDPAKLTVDPDCANCKIKYKDPNAKELMMYLHAYKYEGPDWEYSTDVPTWAMADWQDPES